MYAFVDDPSNSLDVGCHERLVELLVEEARSVTIVLFDLLA